MDSPEMFGPVTPRHFPWLEDQEVGVVLTGGLGNQLFQAAAGLALAERHGVPLALVDNVLQPRSDSNGQADVFSLLESHNNVIRVVPQEASRTLGIRATQWRIASCNAGYTNAQRRLRSDLAALAELGALGLPKVHRRKLWSQNGIGYDMRFQDVGVGRLLVGYFQSYRYPLDLRREPTTYFRLHSKPSRLFTKLHDEFASTAFTTLHIRRGDYRLHPHFGLLTTPYYERALEATKARSQGRRLVRVFSNDIVAAMELLEGLRGDYQFDYVHDHDLTASETVSLMRLGDTFVTANSSMSYWAAMLSDKPGAAITYPEPWFADHPCPSSLAPPTWIQVNSSFQ